MAAKAAKAKSENQGGNKLRVTLVKSPIGNPNDQKLTVKALGLQRIRQTILHPDNPSVRGMIKKVIHLVAVEEVRE
jgi:large subunit ribosomal protein L30